MAITKIATEAVEQMLRRVGCHGSPRRKFASGHAAMTDSPSAMAIANRIFGREAFPSPSKNNDFDHDAQPSARAELSPSKIDRVGADFSAIIQIRRWPAALQTDTDRK
jgi:hypothetical protein